MNPLARQHAAAAKVAASSMSASFQGKHALINLQRQRLSLPVVTCPATAGSQARHGHYGTASSGALSTHVAVFVHVFPRTPPEQCAATTCPQPRPPYSPPPSDTHPAQSHRLHQLLVLPDLLLPPNPAPSAPARAAWLPAAVTSSVWPGSTARPCIRHVTSSKHAHTAGALVA